MFNLFSRIFLYLVMAAISGLFVFPAQAYAYLDPGTGSMILQGIIGGLAAAAVVAKLYWHRLLRFFGFRKDSSPDDQKLDYHKERHDAASDPENLNK